VFARFARVSTTIAQFTKVSETIAQFTKVSETIARFARVFAIKNQLLGAGFDVQF
jgi:hypothetical protein